MQFYYYAALQESIFDKSLSKHLPLVVNRFVNDIMENETKNFSLGKPVVKFIYICDLWGPTKSPNLILITLLW